ncbi:hypothetical protein QE377_001015 [Microbacterium sp. SORGH_AS 862]|nr:hypothetical protein [Microbacterium sp. SORGH_AS_0862]
MGSHPRPQPRDPHLQPRPRRRRHGPRGRHRRDAVAQPAARRRLQVQPAPRGPCRHRRDLVDRRPRQRAHRDGPDGREAHPLCRHRRRHPRAVRLPRGVRTRPRRDHRHRGDQEGRHPHRRRPSGRRLRGLLGADRRALRPRPHRRESRRRPDVEVHDPRLGREDPHGSVLSQRHGSARRPPRRVRHPHRKRRGCGSPRHRHSGCGPHEPEPLPGGRDRLPLLAPTRPGPPRPPSARPSCRR